MLRVVLAEMEERQELEERLVPLGQGTMVLTETPVILVIMAQPELGVRQETQEILVLLAMLGLVAMVAHEVTAGRLVAEVMEEVLHL